MKEKQYYRNEINRPVSLCNSRGLLEEGSIGWSKYPFHDCRIAANKFRIKKWDYWSAVNDEYFITAAITDMGYIKTAFLYIIDKINNKLYEKAYKTPVQKCCQLSERVYGSTFFRTNAAAIEFTKTEEGIEINAKSTSFPGGSFEIKLSVGILKEQETLNVVIPWDSSRYHFTSKQNCLPVKGIVKLGEKIIEFKEGNALASLDYGRGIWPYKSFWNWASLSAMQNGKRIGLNVGGGWTDGTGSNENAFFVDNNIYKLDEDVSFMYDKAKKLKPWEIATKDSDRIKLVFTPTYHRLAKNNIVLVRSELHQIFGHFSGDLKLDNGDIISIKDLYGCVEEHNARW